MTDALSLDWETFSECDLKKAGAFAYAQHASTDILCAGWAFGDEEPALWLPGQPCPPRIAGHVSTGGKITAWNALFEWAVWGPVAGAKYGWPIPAAETLHCTAAAAANLGLPRDLDGAASALGGGAAQKDLAGKRVMLSLSRPRKPTKDDPRTRWTPAMAPEKFAHLYRYCLDDVRAERGILSRIYALSPQEREVYLLNAEMNARGIRIDRPLIEAAKTLVDAELLRLDAEMAKATDYAVTKCSQNKKLVGWLQHRGVAAEGVAKSVITELLAADDDSEDLISGHNGGPPLDDLGSLPPDVRSALLIRQEAAKSSTAKLNAMLRAAGPDDRIRGSVLYYGASRTGRESGRLHQPQNFTRGLEAVTSSIPLALDLIRSGDLDGMRLTLGTPLDVVSSCLRPCMVAAEGHDLVAVDFANIEGRMLAWMAGEVWKLDAFRAYDAGTGPDLYKVAYSKSFGVALAAVTKAQRQVGKVQELSCGYQGWVGAVLTFAKLYGLAITEQEAAAMAGGWREAHPRSVKLWRETNDAAFKAVASPGKKYDAGPVTYLAANDYLWCRLPSGRVLAYCRPSIARNDRNEDAVHYWGVPNPAKALPKGPGNTRRWAKMSGYGGLFVENNDQAISRDVLVSAEARLVKHGYPMVLKVHDELVAEVPVGFGSVKEMEQIAAEVPSWAKGLPIAAAGTRSFRYGK